MNRNIFLVRLRQSITSLFDAKLAARTRKLNFYVLPNVFRITFTTLSVLLTNYVLDDLSHFMTSRRNVYRQDIDTVLICL